MTNAIHDDSVVELGAKLAVDHYTKKLRGVCCTVRFSEGASPGVVLREAMDFVARIGAVGSNLREALDRYKEVCEHDIS